MPNPPSTMRRTKDLVTKLLATVGTAMIWFPILAPLILSAASLARDHVLRFDYLMPAELFPAVLLGGVLLLWSTLCPRLRRILIGGGLAAATGSLAGPQALAVISGLASGRIGPHGWWWGLGLSLLACHVLAVAIVGTGGLLPLKDLRTRNPSKSPAM
jgi:hypothetical protein